ncbi:MAG: glucosaminidase domain-containing protein [Peptostreptococcaceae bacterium]
MKLSKKVVSLICLLFMMLIASPSSISNIMDNSNLSSINTSPNSVNTIKQTSVVESSQESNADRDQKLVEEEKLKIEIEKDKREQEEKQKQEEQRKKSVTYHREDITILSNITKEEMRNVLLHYKGASTMAHLADALVDAEKTQNVNAFVMAAIVALESGFATSRRAIEDNNLTGYEVYSDDSEGRLFSSQYESVVHTARHLSKNYLTEGAMYYKGLSVDAVQLSYCPDEGKGKNWDGKVDKLASGFLKVYKQLYL